MQILVIFFNGNYNFPVPTGLYVVGLGELGIHYFGKRSKKTESSIAESERTAAHKKSTCLVSLAHLAD